MRAAKVALVILVSVASGATEAGARGHHRRTMALAPTKPAAPSGARLDRPLRTAARRVERAPSFVELHTARVKRDLMLFHPDFPGLDPPLPREIDRAAAASEPLLLFVSPPRSDDLVDLARRRDRLLLFRPERHGGGDGAALGLGMFTAMTMMAAHMPEPLRLLFDRRVHLGPAIFDDGGMGAGLAATGL